MTNIASAAKLRLKRLPTSRNRERWSGRVRPQSLWWPGMMSRSLWQKMSKALNQVEQAPRRAIGKIAERASMIKISPAAHPHFRRKCPCYAKCR